MSLPGGTLDRDDIVGLTDALETGVTRRTGVRAAGAGLVATLAVSAAASAANDDAAAKDGKTGDHGYRPCAAMLRQSGGRGIASGGASDSDRGLRTRRPPIPQAGPAIHPATRSWRS